MKRVLSLTLFLALVLALALTACGGKDGGSSSAAKTPEELNKAYAEAISAAQSDEERMAFPLIPADDPMYNDILSGMLGLAPEDLTASAVVVSMRGIQAYSIIAAMPAEGKADTVRKGLEDYVEFQKGNFQFYLEDQYDVACNAKLDTLDDGTILLVMCEDQDTVFNSIKTALEK